MDPQVVTVRNLKTGEELTFVGVCPSEAVIAAHARSVKNFNTWEYNQDRYPCRFTSRFVVCGDCCARL